MNDLRLYEIAGDIQAILSTDEWTDETFDLLEGLSMALEVKADNIAALIGTAESQIEMCKAEEKRIAELRRVRENKVGWLKGYLQRAMEAADREKIEVGTRRISLTKNPPKVVVTDEESLPARFVEIVQSYKVDKAALKAALKNEAIPGAHLEQGRSIRIK